MIKLRLFKLVENTKKYLILSVLSNWMILLSNIISMIFVSILIQKIFLGISETTDYIMTCTVIITFGILKFVFNEIYALSSHKASSQAKISLRNKVMQKIIILGTSYINNLSSAEMIQVSTEGIEQLEIYFGRYLPQLIYSMVAPLTLFIVISFISVKPAVVLLACVPLIPLSIAVVMRYAKKLFKNYWTEYVDLGKDFLDNLQGLTTLKIYKADENRNVKMNLKAEKFRKITMKVLTMQLNSIVIMDLAAFGGAAAGIITAIYEFAAGKIELWGIFSIIMLSSEFFVPLRTLGSLFHVAMNGMSAGDKIFQILDIKNDDPSDEHTNNSCIELEDVSFSYGNGEFALKNINMRIKSGSIVSIVGESGSGKSTVAGLLTGMNGGYTGSIKIGGSEIKNISKDNLLKTVTFIGNDSYIFSGTVEYNLRMGNPDATYNQMKDVLKQVKLYDFIMYKGGLDFKLNEQGTNISGGQRQRLALARALLHDSSIYILDEATSNIDVESEESIMSVVYNLAEIKTVIIITHRLANSVKSDKIYVLEGGKLKEEGCFEELHKKHGLYARLYNLQSSMESYVKGDMANA